MAGVVELDSNQYTQVALPKQHKELVIEEHHSVRRGLRSVKKELSVVSHSLDKNFFVSIIGPLRTWFHPTAQNTEWAMMRQFAKHPKDWWRLAKLLTEDLLSVFIIPMGFLLMARATFRFKNTTEGDEYLGNNDLEKEDWWYINGIGVNGGMLACSA